MSHFDGTIYAIVAFTDATNEMYNTTQLAFSSSDDTLRTTNDGSQILFKFKPGDTEAFRSHAWYNQEEILEILKLPEWNEA